MHLKIHRKIRLKHVRIIAKSSFFDKEWYDKQYPPLFSFIKRNSARHYLTTGWKKGYNPCPDFDGQMYLDMHPEIVGKDICPLIHYEQFGRNEEYKFDYNKFTVEYE